MARKPKNLNEQIAEQRRWIQICGGTLAGYIARYGSKNDPERYGDGGEAIYAADTAALQKLERQRDGRRA